MFGVVEGQCLTKVFLAHVIFPATQQMILTSNSVNLWMHGAHQDSVYSFCNHHNYGLCSKLEKEHVSGVRLISKKDLIVRHFGTGHVDIMSHSCRYDGRYD